MGSDFPQKSRILDWKVQKSVYNVTYGWLLGRLGRDCLDLVINVVR